MITTAKKIQNLEARIAALRDDLQAKQDALDRLHLDLAKFEESIKPPDPEPFECWVYFSNQKPMSVFSAPDCVGSPLTYMRQVTPQMEQDAKDAARYRYLKEKEALVASSKAPIYMHSPYQWDEMIDKALKDELSAAKRMNYFPFLSTNVDKK